MTDLIIKVDKGDKQEELRNRLLDTINEYSNMLNGFEMIGVVDVVREDCHRAVQELDEE